MEESLSLVLRDVVGALVFASDRGLSLRDIWACLTEVRPEAGTEVPSLAHVTEREVEEALEEIRRVLEQTRIGFCLSQVAGGYRLESRPQCGPWVKHLLRIGGRNRLSMAALETLSIIAYRQPITRAEIERIRGVNVDHILHSLLDLQMVRICGRRTELPGRPFLYGTTQVFLEHFGLKSLKDLEDLDPLLARIRSGEPARPAKETVDLRTTDSHDGDGARASVWEAQSLQSLPEGPMGSASM